MIGTGACTRNDNIKNVIVLISDGTSVPVLSLSRWYQWGVLNGDDRLVVDPYLSGMVKTHDSEAVIGDSASTASSYFTGYRSQSGFVSIYPRQTADDIYPVDISRALQPMATVGEAMRIMQDKSVGLVVTCEFPHATPAAAMSHNNRRNDYASLSSVMVHNGINVMFGGGTDFINDAHREYLKSTGTGYVANDLNAFRDYKGDSLWALFGNTAQPYDIDRDPAETPSLAEMTAKALDMLSQNRKGFFLTVEGSKVDWAAHNNDVIGIVTEFLAFNAAIKEALEFAKKDGNTLVLVLSDHGNSGISIGSAASYGKDSLESLIGPLRNIKLTPEGLARKINYDRIAPENIAAFIEQYTGIYDLSEKSVEAILRAGNYFGNNLPEDEKNGTKSLEQVFTSIISERTIIAFTTFGHTGEDVFLASYHPKGRIARGLQDGTEINQYLLSELGLTGALDNLTNQIYLPHTEVFNGMEYAIVDDEADGTAVLNVKNGTGQLSISGNTNIAMINGKRTELQSVAVYISENKTFYLPHSLRAQLTR